MSASRSCSQLLCEKGVWVVIIAIVRIVRPCVAYCVEMIMKCLNVLYANPSPVYFIKMHYTWEGVALKKDLSRVSKQQQPLWLIRFKLAKIICFGQYNMNDVSLGDKSWY